MCFWDALGSVRWCYCLVDTKQCAAWQRILFHHFIASSGRDGIEKDSGHCIVDAHEELSCQAITAIVPSLWDRVVRSLIERFYGGIDLNMISTMLLTTQVRLISAR